MYPRSIVKTFFALAALSILPALHGSTLHVSFGGMQFTNANDSPFYLDFTLTGTAGNSVTISSFNFGAGQAVPNTGAAINGASGSLSTAIVLTDNSAFYNDFFQQFVPGSSLTFNIDMTNIDGSTPDALTLSLLDFSTLPVPTFDPTGANTLFTGNLGSAQQFSSWAVDISQSTSDRFYPAIPAATFTAAATPEGSTWVYGLIGLAALCMAGRRRLAGALAAVLCVAAAGTASAQTCTLLSAPSGSPIFAIAGHSASAVALADFDGDGIPDMAVATTGESPNAFLAVFKGNGSGGFSPYGGSPFALSGTLMNLGDAASLAAADFNRDGKMDLILTSTTGSVIVITGNGNGQFNIPTSANLVVNYSAGYPPVAEVADLNGDGFPDVVISSSSTYILLNSAGTLATSQLLSAEHTGVWLGDVNGDGYPDIVGSGGKIYPNNTHGSFSPLTATVTFPAVVGRPSVVVADFNGDGKADLLFTGVNGASSSIQYQVFAGDGTGNFTAGALTQTGIVFNGAGLTYNVLTGDFNGDGLPDFAFSQRGPVSGAAYLYVYVGTGSGAFATASGSPFSTGTIGSSELSLASLDLNSDGRPDLALAGRDSNGNAVAYVFLTNAQTVTIGVTTSANPMIVGSALTVTAVLGGIPTCANPTGHVSFAVDGGPKSFATPANGQASVTLTAGLTAGVHTIIASYAGDGNFRPATVKYVQLVGASSCSANLTSQVTVKPGGFVFDRARQQFVQTVSITNNGPDALTGPVSLALDTLSANAALVSPSGYTGCAAPAGSPLADVGICPGTALAPGGTATLFLRFTDPTLTAISYTPRVLAGLAPR